MSAAACSAPTPNQAACVGASPATVAQLQGGVSKSGTLRHARMFTRAGDATFVSAEFLPSDKPQDFKGDILTWFTTSIDSGQFEAVDAHARDLSSWPHARFDVREDGAITSRGCVLPLQGKP
jgi:hypothetical protein